MSSVKAVYGCNSKDDHVRLESSSGGVFTVLAEHILSAGGVVYGTAMSSDCKKATFQRVDKAEHLPALRGSKYLQSSLGDTYKQVKQDLISGVNVLFSGCPCQVNGLKLFLDNEYHNLICVDIICHGVPSPAVWRKYADYVEAENHAVLRKVNFRSKESSWNEFGLGHSFGQKDVFSSKHDNPYLQLFLKNYTLRPSCYECTSKSYRSADISIGDFWGIENVLPNLNDKKGTSLVILRTSTGADLFDRVKDSVIFTACEYEQAVEHNSADYKSVARPAQRDSFFRDMNRLTFDELKKKYLASGLKEQLKAIIKKIARK